MSGKSSEDSRLRGYSGRETHPVFSCERTYCSNCGKPWGWTSQDSSQLIAAAEIIVYCESCFEGLNSKGGRISSGEMARLGLCEENLQEGTC